MTQEKRVLVIAGPTGSGESTVTKEIMKRYPSFTRLVTATTREPRLNEQDGVDYYFFDGDRFTREIAAGDIIEHTFVPGRGVYYGTYKPDLEKKLAEGRSIIVNPDVVGARYYKEHYNATTIFIKTPTIENLRDRLVTRDPSISEAELAQRLEAAQYELDHEESFYDFVVVNVDNQLEKTINTVDQILREEGYSL